METLLFLGNTETIAADTENAISLKNRQGKKQRIQEEQHKVVGW